MIVLFDIGKTNKKCFIFNEDYRIVFERTTQLPETTDEDEEVCEDLERLSNWVVDTVREVLTDSRFHIRAINVTAYGASFVHLDRNGRPVTPLYNYVKEFPWELKKQFFDRYGEEGKVALETASPVLGNLNSGLQLYWLKQRKSLIFKEIKWSLHLPQYVSFLLKSVLRQSGGDLKSPPDYAEHAASEITSIGCHTMLWDFQKNDYHDWVKAEGIAEKFPPIKPSDSVLPGSISIGHGLHDSSAALIPYLRYFDEPFVLISTGTWCISLNPFNDEPMTEEELRQDCLCYLSYEGRAVKAARYFGGNEHELAVKELAARFGVNEDFYRIVDLDDPSELSKSYRHFMRQLVEKQAVSTRLALGNAPVRRIFVDGGFSKNELYLTLLAAAFPEMEVFSAEIAQATALGAALAIHPSWNSKTLPPHLISLKKYAVPVS